MPYAAETGIASAATESRPRALRWCRALRKEPQLWIGATVLIVLVASALLAPLVAPYNPLAPDYSVSLHAPSARAPLRHGQSGARSTESHPLRRPPVPLRRHMRGADRHGDRCHARAYQRLPARLAGQPDHADDGRHPRLPRPRARPEHLLRARPEPAERDYRAGGGPGAGVRARRARADARACATASTSRRRRRSARGRSASSCGISCRTSSASSSCRSH